MCDPDKHIDELNFTTVRFVTANFGTLDNGSIIDAYLLNECNNEALLYFPPDKEGSGCFIIAERVSANLWKDSKLNYVNFGPKSRMFQDGLPTKSLFIKEKVEKLPKKETGSIEEAVETINSLESDLDTILGLVPKAFKTNSLGVVDCVKRLVEDYEKMEDDCIKAKSDLKKIKKHLEQTPAV